MDREAAHVTDVGEVAEQFETVDEVPAGVEAAVELERQDRTLTAGRVPLGTVVPRLERRPG